MGADDTSELTPELLNDFFAECEEHLNIIRQALVTLEKGVEPDQQVTLIEKLFRSFHSLKGIVAMAGITPAEHLTHRTEDYLRELSLKSMSLTPQGLDLLALVVQLLDQSVVAFRQKEPFPDVTKVVEQFGHLESIDRLSSEDESPEAATPIPDALQNKIEEARQKGLSVWKASFIPSSALNEQGVNVNAIRGRLTALGEIIHAAPQIGPGSAISFEFFLALRTRPENESEWNKAGVLFTKIAEPSPFALKSQNGAPAPTALAVAPSQLIRVELSRLDDLMRIAGELVTERARLEGQINLLAASESVDVRGLQEVNLGLARHFRDLRETVMRLRMVPIAEIFDRMPFVVRDLVRGSRKAARLEVQGQQTELDKYVVERLKDPLLHLVRNAISHGIEDGEERVSRGKPAEATITLAASTSGETVIIEVSDDGRGIDAKKIAKRAAEMGIQVPDTLSDSALLDILSLPGFSTRDEADRAAGRGVGMAVVANTLRELNGHLYLQTELDRGTAFTLRLPLTLLITDALIISSGEQKFAVPQNNIHEVVQIEESKVKRMERAELLSFRGGVLPLVRLRSAFGFPPAKNTHSSVLIAHTERGDVGLVVDRILGQRQIVVRSLRDPLIHVPGVMGATELGDGRPLLILDAAALAKQNGAKRSALVRVANEHAGSEEKNNESDNTRRGILHPV